MSMVHQEVILSLPVNSNGDICRGVVVGKGTMYKIFFNHGINNLS